MGSMKVPIVSPGNRGYEVVSITTTWRRVTKGRRRGAGRVRGS